MVQLTLDTSSITCAVHIQHEDGRVHEISKTIGHGHAEHLIGMIDEAMEELAVSFVDLTKIVVALGPGSFTGVRVGLAAAKGYALALDIPVVGVSTLHAIQRQNTHQTPTLVALDAKRDQLYTELFDGEGRSIDGPCLHVISDPMPNCWLEQGALTLVGSGAEALRAQLPDGRIVNLAAVAKISDIADLGARAKPSSAALKPLYLRSADAKPQNPNKRISRVQV